MTNPLFEFFDRHPEYVERTLALSAGETLFGPGDDPYFYLVDGGIVEVFVAGSGSFRRTVGQAGAGEFLGEWVLFGKTIKTVWAEAGTGGAQVRAVSESTLGRIGETSSTDLATILRFVLQETNTRLNEAGRELGLIHDVVREISEHPEGGKKALVSVLKFMHRAFFCSAILLLEAHPVIPNLWMYVFDSRFPSTRIMEKAGDETASLAEINPENAGQFRNIPTDHDLFVLPLVRSGASNAVGALVFARPTAFSTIEERVFQHFAGSLASMLRTDPLL